MIAVFIILWIFHGGKRRFRKEAAKIKVRIAKDDEKYYLAALEEWEADRSEELWAKALTIELGDEQKAKFRYVTLRVPQLKSQAIDSAASRAAETDNKKKFCEECGRKIYFEYEDRSRRICEDCAAQPSIISEEKGLATKIFVAVLLLISLFIIVLIIEAFIPN